MKITHTDHLKNRLKQRGISIKIVGEIFDKPKEYYFDNSRNHHIVVSTVLYKDKLRKMLAAYDTIEDIVEVITIHPITDEQIKQRINSGRWIYEKVKD